MSNSERIVVKVGTSTLTDGTPHLSRQRMLEVVQQIARLHQAGHELILVTSGAVAAGRERLGTTELSRSIPTRQMLSAVGQSRLMQVYTDLFDIFRIVVAQLLLTRGDLNSRAGFLNARDTISTLIDRRIVPVINENDTTATEEIRIGDNDNLSALVATLVEADRLILLTDQPGLFTADPRRDQNATLIERVEQIDAGTYALAGGAATGLGTGGMVTKLQAAQLATRGGVTTWIASGKIHDALGRIVAGDSVGTRFEALSTALESRKRWLLVEKPRGRLTVDAGAARKLQAGGASLLPVGVTQVEGDFSRGETVAVFGPSQREIAHGIISYDAEPARRLCGVKSSQIVEVLGYSYGDALIHRNNMVLLK
ncbi:MAG: glutamate 5-kinase [Anaerolineae bacterium]|nr:glutamate 5-kinase [Anaerolineae bacterium]